MLPPLSPLSPPLSPLSPPQPLVEASVPPKE
jgi:hypothetical protein